MSSRIDWANLRWAMWVSSSRRTSPLPLASRRWWAKSCSWTPCKSISNSSSSRCAPFPRFGSWDHVTTGRIFARECTILIVLFPILLCGIQRLSRSWHSLSMPRKVFSTTSSGIRSIRVIVLVSQKINLLILIFFRDVKLKFQDY